MQQDARDYELSKALFPKLFSSQTAKHPQMDARQRDTTNRQGLVDRAGSSLALGAQALRAATSDPGGETGPGGHTALGAGAAGCRTARKAASPAPHDPAPTPPGLSAEPLQKLPPA